MSLLFCLLIAAAQAAQNDPVPEARPAAPWPMRGYACVRTAGEIVVDGRPDEAAWSAAAWTDPFVDIEGDRRPQPRFATRAKLLWDDACFYIAAELEEPHLWATLRQRDSIIYHDNDFEVFIDPDGDSHLYSELEINALNTVWDLLLVKPYRDGGPAIHAWDIPDLRTAVHLDGTLDDPGDRDRGWSVEIAIPWSVLAETTEAACPPVAKDRWRVNFSRVQWRLETVDGGYRKVIDPLTGKSLPEDNWVWSPQRQIAMHEPEYWGIVEFRDHDSAQPVLPTVEDAGAWHLRQVSYLLAALHEKTGKWPPDFVPPVTSPYGPPLAEDWSWPPAYASDGDRYSLTLGRRDGSGQLVLHEDGRLVRTP